MKPRIKTIATALAATLQLAVKASVPLAWDVRPGQPAPVTFDRYHGETIDFSATFRGFGELPFAPDADIRLWYQTNGMGTAWWSAPATIQSNVLSATWSPELDPGAERVSLFFGAPSNTYAAAVLRLRHSPGFTPTTPPPPTTFQESDPAFSTWLSTFTIPETSLEPSTNYTDRSLYSFAATGTVFRSASYGTPAHWTDATGCVWEVTLDGAPWVDGDNTLVYTDDGYGVCWMWGGIDMLEYSHGTWSYSCGHRTASFVATGPEDATVLVMHDVSSDPPLADITLVRIPLTNLVGRVAITNDIPEWPIGLVTTNSPILFADGDATNVPSVAIHAGPTNYSALSFMTPVSWYLPNRFSLLELGHDYQIAAAQWFQVGRFLYAPSPDRIVFFGGELHKSLQEYLDACSPEAMSDLLGAYVPTNGGGRIHGDLEIDGQLKAGSLVTITNSDIIAKGFSVIDKVLTADGLYASNGMVRLHCARFMLGFGTPRIHVETNDIGSAFTYGGTWEHPAGNLGSYYEGKIEQVLAGNIQQQDLELRNPYVRHMDVKDGFAGWKIKSHAVNNGPLKHFTLTDYRTHHFTDSDVGNYGIEFTITSNAHVRIVYDFASAPPSAVYFDCGRDGNDESATMLSNGTELLSPTAGAKTLIEIEHLSGWTFMVKETPLTQSYTVQHWAQSQEEEEP